MYKIVKRMEIAGSHCLNLPYESKCSNLHGHNWIIEVMCVTEKLTEYGMVIDFTELKKLVHDQLDHKNLSGVFDFNTTAENMAYWIGEQINNYLNNNPSYHISTECVKVSVQESEGNIAIWENERCK